MANPGAHSAARHREKFAASQCAIYRELQSGAGVKNQSGAGVKNQSGGFDTSGRPASPV